jgi:hypothetical protein
MVYTTSDLIPVTAYGATGDGATDDTAATLDLAAGPVLSG